MDLEPCMDDHWTGATMRDSPRSEGGHATASGYDTPGAPPPRGRLPKRIARMRKLKVSRGPREPQATRVGRVGGVGPEKVSNGDSPQHSAVPSSEEQSLWNGGGRTDTMQWRELARAQQTSTDDLAVDHRLVNDSLLSGESEDSLSTTSLSQVLELPLRFGSPCRDTRDFAQTGARRFTDHSSFGQPPASEVVSSLSSSYVCTDNTAGVSFDYNEPSNYVGSLSDIRVVPPLSSQYGQSIHPFQSEGVTMHPHTANSTQLYYAKRIPLRRKHLEPSKGALYAHEADDYQATMSWTSPIGQNKVFCRGRIISGPDVSFGLLSLALILIPSVLFDATVAPWYAHQVTYGFTVGIFGGLIQLVVIFGFFFTAFSDPGIIPRQRDPHNAFDLSTQAFRSKLPSRHQDIVVNCFLWKMKYCPTCNIHRPPRCVHCSICDNCVEKFDHHCPWVGNCIGRRNYRRFYAFISSVSLLSLYVLAASFGMLYMVIAEHVEITGSFGNALRSFWTDGWPGFALSLYCFGFVWFPTSIGVYHSYLIVSNQTTYEQIKGTFEGEDENPWDRGPLGNCQEALCVTSRPRLFDTKNLVIESVYEPRTRRVTGDAADQLGAVDASAKTTESAMIHASSSPAQVNRSVNRSPTAEKKQQKDYQTARALSRDSSVVSSSPVILPGSETSNAIRTATIPPSERIARAPSTPSVMVEAAIALVTSKDVQPDTTAGHASANAKLPHKRDLVGRNAQAPPEAGAPEVDSQRRQSPPGADTEESPRTQLSRGKLQFEPSAEVSSTSFAGKYGATREERISNVAKQRDFAGQSSRKAGGSSFSTAPVHSSACHDDHTFGKMLETYITDDSPSTRTEHPIQQHPPAPKDVPRSSADISTILNYWHLPRRQRSSFHSIRSLKTFTSADFGGSARRSRSSSSNPSIDSLRAFNVAAPRSTSSVGIRSHNTVTPSAHTQKLCGRTCWHPVDSDGDQLSVPQFFVHDHLLFAAPSGEFVNHPEVYSREPPQSTRSSPAAAGSNVGGLTHATQEPARGAPHEEETSVGGASGRSGVIEFLSTDNQGRPCYVEDMLDASDAVGASAGDKLRATHELRELIAICALCGRSACDCAATEPSGGVSVNWEGSWAGGECVCRRGCGRGWSTGHEFTSALPLIRSSTSDENCDGGETVEGGVATLTGGRKLRTRDSSSVVEGVGQGRRREERRNNTSSCSPNVGGGGAASVLVSWYAKLVKPVGQIGRLVAGTECGRSVCVLPEDASDACDVKNSDLKNSDAEER